MKINKSKLKDSHIITLGLINSLSMLVVLNFKLRHRKILVKTISLSSPLNPRCSKAQIYILSYNKIKIIHHTK